MRILICTGIYPPDIGGPAIYSKLLKDGLSKHDFDVEVLSFGEVRSLPKIIRHLVYFFKVFSRGFSADIIYAQDPVSVGLPSALAARLINKKFLLKIVGDYAWEQASQRFCIKDSLDDFLEKKYCLFVEILKLIERFTADKADLIIVPSNYLKTIVAKWGIRREKIRVIYNAFEVADARGDKNDLRKLLDLGGFVLLSVGRLVPWKGFGVLIDAMPELLKISPDFRLLIIGSGPEENDLMLKIKNRGLSGSVSLLGQKSHNEVLKYLIASDVFILNTFYEGLSHQLLEAMASNIPIITTPVGGNPELIKDGESGIFVDYNNKEQIVAAVKTIFKSKKLSQKLVISAFERVGEFSKEKMIGEISEVFKSL